MATWQEVTAALAMVGARQLGETIWAVDIELPQSGLMKSVFVCYEFMEPDFEIVKIAAPVSEVSASNINLATLTLGGLLVGAMSYTPRNGSDPRVVNGFINLGTTIPLTLLDLSDPRAFLIYVNMVGQAAAQLGPMLK